MKTTFNFHFLEVILLSISFLQFDTTASSKSAKEVFIEASITSATPVFLLSIKIPAFMDGKVDPFAEWLNNVAMNIGDKDPVAAMIYR